MSIFNTRYRDENVRPIQVIKNCIFRKPNITSDWSPQSKKTSDPWMHLRIDSPDKLYMEKKEQVGNQKFWESLPFKENQKLFNKRDEL